MRKLDPTRLGPYEPTAKEWRRAGLYYAVTLLILFGLWWAGV